MIMANELELSLVKTKNPHPQNLTRGERSAMRNLSRNKDIVIKPADKGSAVVILNTRDYIAEGDRQLNDDKFYQKLDQNKTREHNQLVHNTVDSMQQRGELSGECSQYLKKTDPRTSQLYLLPKIHKGKIPPPGRPIISANASPTERISQFVDFFLQPDLNSIKSYVRDTSDFIMKLQSITEDLTGCTLLAFDVGNMYNNIEHPEGVRAVHEYLEEHRKHGVTPFNTSIIELSEHVLELNNFEFNGEHYLQVSGTAMGTKLAPSYANIFMSAFEEKFIYPYPGFNCVKWLRFLDDIFCIWSGTDESLDAFITYLNSVHNRIKFTVERSKTSVNFLDTTVHLENGRLWTDLYCKETDSHNYLHFDSAHPKHCKTSLPYSQLLRLKRICSYERDFLKHSGMILAHFQRRGYSVETLQAAMNKVKVIKREDLLREKTEEEEKQTDQVISIITSYTPQCNELPTLVKKNWGIVQRSSTTKNLAKRRLVVAYRRPKNLRDILVRAKLPDNNGTNNETSLPLSESANACRTRNCRYCKILDHSGRIKSHTTGREYNCKKHVTCKSSNLIYCITCTSCGMQYVGQTKLRLMDRFGNHFTSIQRNDGKNDVCKHFNGTGHAGIDNLQLHILDFIHAAPNSEFGRALRDHIEFHWIQRLRTQLPHGINTMDKSPATTAVCKNWKKAHK